MSGIQGWEKINKFAMRYGIGLLFTLILSIRSIWHLDGVWIVLNERRYEFDSCRGQIKFGFSDLQAGSQIFWKSYRLMTPDFEFGGTFESGGNFFNVGIPYLWVMLILAGIAAARSIRRRKAAIEKS